MTSSLSLDEIIANINRTKKQFPSKPKPKPKEKPKPKPRPKRKRQTSDDHTYERRRRRRHKFEHVRKFVPLYKKPRPRERFEYKPDTINKCLDELIVCTQK